MSERRWVEPCEYLRVALAGCGQPRGAGPSSMLSLRHLPPPGPWSLVPGPWSQAR